jgi:hypothetical protein
MAGGLARLAHLASENRILSGVITGLIVALTIAVATFSCRSLQADSHHSGPTRVFEFTSDDGGADPTAFAECHASNLTARPGALRCFAGSTIYDPCFASSTVRQTSQAKCPNDPGKDEDDITLVTDFTEYEAWLRGRNQSTEFSKGSPWFLVTDEGDRCMKLSGAGAFSVELGRVPFSCGATLGSISCSEPVADGSIWTTECLYGRGTLERRRQGLREVWY